MIDYWLVDNHESDGATKQTGYDQAVHAMRQAGAEVMENLLVMTKHSASLWRMKVRMPLQNNKASSSPSSVALGFISAVIASINNIQSACMMCRSM